MDNIDTAEMLAAASSSGNSDALSLALQLTDTEPCLNCVHLCCELQAEPGPA